MLLLLLTWRYAKLVLVENAALGRLQAKKENTKKKKTKNQADTFYTATKTARATKAVKKQHFEAFGLRLISSNWQINALKAAALFWPVLLSLSLSLGHFYGVLKAFDSAQRSQRLSI